MLSLPPDISDAELLALLEGQTASLAPDRREAVRAAVAADPELARFVRESRTDAAAMRSMARAEAPDSVRDAVFATLQRPTIIDNPLREPVGGQIPVSSLSVPNPWRRLIERAPVREFALAASLLLVAGLGVWVISQAVKSGPVSPSPNRPIASNTDSGPAGSPDSLALPSAADAPALASGEPDTGDLVSGPMAIDDFGFPTIPAELAAKAVAPVLAKAAPAGMPPSEAAALAREGRLVIRLRTFDADASTADVRQLAQRTSTKDVQWRPLEPWELSEVTVALRLQAPGDTILAVAKRPTDIAGASTTTPPSPAAPLIAPIGTPADVASALKLKTEYRPLYTVELDENERDLAALVSRLTRGTSQVAEFVALDEPLPTLMPSTDPSAVLWWTRPPTGWTRKVCVPIVLETIR